MAHVQGIQFGGDEADERARRIASLDAWLDDLHGTVTADATADERRWWGDSDACENSVRTRVV